MRQKLLNHVNEPMACKINATKRIRIETMIKCKCAPYSGNDN